MRKIRLDVSEVRVTSFATEGGGTDARGTVRGHDQTLWHTCQGGTCDGQETCWDSCDPNCGTYRCITGDYSCGQLSCVDTCTCNPFDNCR